MFYRHPGRLLIYLYSENSEKAVIIEVKEKIIPVSILKIGLNGSSEVI